MIINQMKYKKTSRTIFFLTFVAWLLALGHSRVLNRQITVTEMRRNKGWVFLDRMSFDEGLATVRLSLGLETPTDPQKSVLSLQLAMVPDQLWQQEQTFKCDQKLENGDSIVLNIDLRKQQNFFTTVKHHTQLKEPKNYHFILRDCDKSIAYQYFRRDSKITLSLEMLNNDEVHGSDERITKFMLPMLLIMTGFMAYVSRGPKHQEAAEERDWAKFILFITLAFNFVALAFNYLGFFVYLLSGSHYGFFDFMYLVFHSISQSILTSLLIFIAYGWTITFTKDAEFDLYIPLVSMLGLINLILTLLGKINDGDSDKYHMYDTIPSYLLVFFRVCTVIIFAVGLIRLFLQNRKNQTIIAFITNFGFMGSIYFLSLPAIMLIAVVLPVSSRKQIVFLSVQIIKNTINLMLTYMISSKKSKYKSIQQSGQSFFQTGNKLL